jgi:hypothetical protein
MSFLTGGAYGRDLREGRQVDSGLMKKKAQTCLNCFEQGEV